MLYHLTYRKLLNISETVIFSLLLAGKPHILQALVKTDASVRAGISSLEERGIIRVHGNIVTLSDSIETQALKNQRFDTSTDLISTENFLRGKFIKYKNKFIPLLTGNSVKLLKQYAEEHSLTDEALLGAIKFYYEDTKESYYSKGRFVVKEARGIKGLLSDKATMSSLLYTKMHYFNKFK